MCLYAETGTMSPPGGPHGLMQYAVGDFLNDGVGAGVRGSFSSQTITRLQVSLNPTCFSGGVDDCTGCLMSVWETNVMRPGKRTRGTTSRGGRSSVASEMFHIQLSRDSDEVTQTGFLRKSGVRHQRKLSLRVGTARHEARDRIVTRASFSRGASQRL